MICDKDWEAGGIRLDRSPACLPIRRQLYSITWWK